MVAPGHREQSEAGEGEEDEGDTSKRGVRGGWLQAPALVVVVFFNIVVVVVDVVVAVAVVVVVVVFSPPGRQASFFLFSPFSNYR